MTCQRPTKKSYFQDNVKLDIGILQENFSGVKQHNVGEGTV